MGVSTNKHDDIGFVVLSNLSEQYSLWPKLQDIPIGWYLEYGPGDRDTCIDYIDRHWAHPSVHNK